MSFISILPDQVANQIAAGEVIERPAGVVKELLENSLDAGAGRVEVAFRHGGRSYMRVEDDGRGMGRDDALLALERHATSKIREARDLDVIASFGFRGEALPSIASVSRFLLRTRAEGDASGTEIAINAGRIVHVRECGMPPGTRIEVSHLFNSVPARRKFLKTDPTEAGHIVHCVRLYALAHPDKAFTLVENGRAHFQSPPCERLGDRIGEIFGEKRLADLLEVEAADGDLRLRGFIGKPGVGRTTRHETLAFVNRRPVESRTLTYALLESYHASLEKGRYPPAFLFLDIPPAAVDVNVHPAKREIRFREEGRVRRFVINAVLRCLEGAKPAAGPAPEPARTVSPGSPEAPGSLAPAAGTPAPRPVARSRPRPVASETAPSSRSPAASAPDDEEPADGSGLDWRFLGLAHGRLAVFETDAGLVLLDRRAAHERIAYEDILEQYERGSVPVQSLLFPVPLEVDALEAGLIDEHGAFMRGNGFELAPFGRNFFRIESVPAWLEPEAVEGFLRDLIGLMKEDNIPGDRSLARERLARLAASRAVRVSDRTGEKEVRRLAERLLACEQPLTNPRGRPTLIEIGHGELEKRFGRR